MDESGNPVQIAGLTFDPSTHEVVEPESDLEYVLFGSQSLGTLSPASGDGIRTIMA
jgi:hypothetical protein